MGLDPVARYFAWAIDGLDRTNLSALCGANRGDSQDCWLGAVDDSDRCARGILKSLRDCGPVDRMLGADFALILPHDHLAKIDIATMAHGLEARSPLLDQELINAVSRYPEAVKLKGLQTKPLLRELARRYLPRTIHKAPKRGFEVPLTRWLRGELRELAEDVILSRDGLLADLFDRSALERLLRDKDGLEPARWSRWVYHLLMLGMWDRLVYKRRGDRSAVLG